MDRRTSNIWSHFTVFDQNKKIAKCDKCLKKYSYHSTLTNLKKHLAGVHSINMSSNTSTVSTNPWIYIYLFLFTKL